MKSIVMLLMFVLMGLLGIAQNSLLVTHNKTTNVIFPNSIAGIDRGSPDIIVQKAAGAENILKVKAQAQGFAETNLSVVTSDGKLYTFTVNYDSAPAELTVRVGKSAEKNTLGALLVTVTGAAENLSVRKSTGEVAISLVGAYVHDEIMMFKYRLSNASSLDYDIDQLRFYVKDRNRSRRTAQQEIEITPLQILGESSKVKAGSQSVLVIAVPKFTLSKTQEFITQLQEHNGARHFHLSGKTRHLKNVRTIN
jgi:conjugative transposon TraN protein